MTTTQQTPVEIDTAQAELYDRLYRVEGSLERSHATLLHMAGAEFYYRGRRRVTDMTPKQAYEIVKAEVESQPEASEYAMLSTARSYSLGSARNTLRELAEAEQLHHDLTGQIEALQAKYTGWPRFFVVTSSAGHIHSSMHCQTCYPTTRYGWLPQISGKSQEQAIEHFGPAAEALCSVCFPDAPVANQDQNLTSKQRDALLAGETPEPSTKKTYCPGSGQQATNRRPGDRYGRCPHCGYVGAVTQYAQMRKHKEQS